MKSRTFVKWAGGKTQLVDSIVKLMPQSLSDDGVNTYVEPFLGSGALFFEIAHRFPDVNFLLNDKNKSLINTYHVVKNKPNGLVRKLEKICDYYCDLDQNSKAFFFQEMKKQYNEVLKKPINYPTIKEAALFIFINKTCFNGLYRLNRNGSFNVPHGNVSGAIFNKTNILDASKSLKKAQLFSLDFKEFINLHIPNPEKTFFYIDPPYTVKHGNNGFLAYNEKIFSWEDQVSLATLSASLRSHGSKVMVSNAHHSDVINLYEEIGFHMSVVSRSSVIGGSHAKRERVSECIFTSYN